MPTHNFNAVQFSIPYVSFTPTANCDQTFSDSSLNSANNEVALAVGFDTSSVSNLDAIQYLQEAVQFLADRQYHAYQNYCFWSLKSKQCGGGPPACGQPYQEAYTNWLGIQKSCSNSGHTCYKTQGALNAQANGWLLVNNAYTNGINGLQDELVVLQAELEQDLNNTQLVEEVQQTIEETNLIIAEANYRITKSAQVEYASNILKYIVPALLILVVTGVGAFILKKYK